jgi:hypothetical protein
MTASCRAASPRPLPTALALLAAALLALPATAAAQRGPRAPSPTGYWPSSTCAGCHPRTVQQHSESHHESSFRNPLFQAQYFEELLPRASRDPKLVDEARSCTACHAPVAWAYQRNYFSGQMPTDPSMSGVTCDLCHTISGIDGPTPRNGNFISRPSEKKLGPFPSDTNWHHVYSELQTKSELCATCHEAVNHNGVTVKGTYSEWKKSPAAAAGIQCQDCHMTRDGFLSEDGKPAHESGKAAEESAYIRAPVRDKLYTHRFPGAHSRAQVEGAIRIGFAHLPPQARPGDKVGISLVVDNHRAGHRMPTGSADLRLLWIEVTARAGANRWMVPATSKAKGGYGVAGDGDRDETLLGKDVPAGSRLYRAIFFDERNEQTLSSYEATRVVWDNRLEPGERRTEPFELELPKGVTGPIQLEARLVYLSYPSALARKMSVAAAEPVEVARATAELPVVAGPRPALVPRGGP